MPRRDFRTVAEQLPTVVWETDPRGACTFINAKWTELTGQGTADAMGMGWRSRIDAHDLVLVDTAARDAWTHGVPLDLEVRLQTLSGGARWVRMVASADVRGKVLLGFVGLLLDVTPARQAVAELGERESQLRLLEARNQALLENLPDMLFQFDADGCFVDYQATASAAFLVAPERFLGKPVHTILPPQIGDAALAAMHRARATGQPQRHEYDLDVHGHGRRDFEARISPMKSGGFLGLVRDVTELKRSERQLIAAREQAMSASSSKSQFLANLSHEIRTPLNGIIGVTQLLRNLALPDDVREYVGVLETAGESLIELVNEVLDLSKIEADRLELQVAPFDVSLLLAQAARAFVAEAQRKQLELIVECDVEPGLVMGDAGRVRQIVNNLVANALKFTDAGSVKVQLRRSPEGLIVLSVVDTGPGVAASLRETIFEPFVQATGQRRQGTGLGLSIARRLAVLMGGDLRLTSTEGRGSTFEARLPLAKGPAVAPAVRQRTVTQPLRVLLAEDNAVNARLTSAMLAWLGHEVTVVADGRAVLEVTLSRAFDLVFMDVQMPHLDGLETTRRLRERERNTGSRLAIAALTANAMKADELACLEAGMDAYLAKPVTVDALNDVLAWFSERVRGTKR
jgi:two-component system sensor histidine kinase/response regulator